MMFTIAAYYLKVNCSLNFFDFNTSELVLLIQTFMYKCL